MNQKHIEFSKLSDLFDELIETEEEKEALLAHIEACQECGREYRALKNTVLYLRDIEKSDPGIPDIASGVLQKIKFRKAVKTAKRAAPVAAAALVLFVLGAGIFMQDRGGVAPVHQVTSTAEESREDLMDILQSSDVKVVRNTDMYVEGEIVYDEFKELRRKLGFREVSFTYVSGQREAPTSWRSQGMTHVGTQDRAGISPLFQEQYDTDPLVRFRVYHKSEK